MSRKTKIFLWVAGVVVALGILGSITSPDEELKTGVGSQLAEAGEQAATAVETAEADKVDEAPASNPEPVEDLSETERVARKIAREYELTYQREEGGFPTSASKLVLGFDDDLDPWDGSLEVTTKLPAGDGAVGKALATEVGASVLGVGFRHGLCTVDVMAENGVTRLVEHQSEGLGC